MDNEKRNSISDEDKWDELLSNVFSESGSEPGEENGIGDGAESGSKATTDPDEDEGVADAVEPDEAVDEADSDVNAVDAEDADMVADTDDATDSDEADDVAVPSDVEDATDPGESKDVAGAIEAGDAGDTYEAEDVGDAAESSEAENATEPDETVELEDAAETANAGAATDAPEIDPEKLKRRRMILGGIAGVAVAAILVGTQIHKHFKEYYSTHFFKGTVINGMDVSKETVDGVKAGIIDNVSKYTLKIKELDRNEKITAGQIGLEYVDDGKVDELMEEQEEGKWLWHLAGSSAYDINAGTKYDEGKMTETIAALECFKEENVTKPQDAALKDENNVVSIQDEVEGNEVNLDKLTNAVTEAVKKGASSIDIVKDDCYNHPSIYRNDETLKARMDKWNELMRVNVTYAFGDNIETVNADTVKPYIVDDGTTVDLPSDWIRTLVYGWGQKYDTFGLARPFTTHSGQEIMIEEGGDYGWCINKDETIADVTDAIFTGAQGERAPTYLYSAMGWDNGDLTGTYVEVSIGEQHLWCYKDYELIMDTDVVTGLPTAERATTPGCFAIDAKKEDATLGSLDVQGYESPVSYWAPFNGGQGLHDAPWRSNFGGDIYMGNGSHGCVNIPPWNMEPIFNAIEIGNAVVVY
ncbi:MAG: peptidoglycan binding domain-containing protein [Lachnospiraceae bacterium]|nr:peptidoglycan binding domain-containing protein [Lachnospiraceae bacterium]